MASFQGHNMLLYLFSIQKITMCVNAKYTQPVRIYFKMAEERETNDGVKELLL